VSPVSEDKISQMTNHSRPVKSNGRKQKPSRQSSTASTTPLYRSDSNASSTSGSSEPTVKFHPKEEPIDETEMEFAGPPGARGTVPQRQDSNCSTNWLIPDGRDYVLQLPPIGETNVDDDIPNTLPRGRHGPKAATGRPDQPSSDPLRRRHVPLSGSPNDGYVPDDDDDDDDDRLPDNAKADAAAIRQNADNMFKIALQQAVMMEQDGLENGVKHLPVSTGNPHDA